MTVSKKRVASFAAIMVVASLGLTMLIASPVSAVTMGKATYDQATGEITVTAEFQTDDKIPLNGATLYMNCPGGAKTASFTAIGEVTSGTIIKAVDQSGTVTLSGGAAVGETVQGKQTGYGYTNTNTALYGQPNGGNSAVGPTVLTSAAPLVIQNAARDTLIYTIELDKSKFNGGDKCSISLRLDTAPLTGHFDSQLATNVQIKPETVFDNADSDGDGVPDSVELATGGNPNDPNDGGDADLTVKGVKVTRVGDEVTIEWTAPSGAVEVYVWRTASPWTLVAKLNPQQASLIRADDNDNSKYQVTFATGYEPETGYVSDPVGSSYANGPTGIVGFNPNAGIVQVDDTPKLTTCGDGVKRIDCTGHEGTDSTSTIEGEPSLPKGIVAYIVLISLSVVIGVGVIVILRMRPE